MGDEKFVTKEMCELLNMNIKETISDIKDSVDSISGDVKELTVISAKLTQLQEIQSKTLITMEKRLSSLEDTQARTVSALEVRVDALEKAKSEPRSEVKVNKTRFTDTKTFEFLVKAGVVILAMVIMAAIGQNYMEDLKSILGK